LRTSSFTTQLQVRDYECDLQGIVNNAVYQHYLEHARHEYLNSKGLDFSELTALGVIIVVIRAELLKVVFEQEIRRLTDDELMLEAKITAVSLKDGERPYFPAELGKLL
jgi:acyl-CoA thioester hydrolase